MQLSIFAFHLGTFIQLDKFDQVQHKQFFFGLSIIIVSALVNAHKKMSA